MSTDTWVEASGDTVDEAIDAVLDLLDLDEEDAEIEIVTAAGRGRGAPIKAMVRARPRDDLVDEVVEDDVEAEAVEEDEVSDDELIEAAQSFCEGMLRSFDLEGDVESWIDEDEVLRVELSGADLAVLIGRRGKTLQSLAELVRTVVQRQTGARTRLFVVVEGYRARRRAALTAYATRLARRVFESGIEVALEPMPAGDRKVVHDTVTSVDGVKTFSEGEEPRRYVVIAPEAAPARSSRRR